MSKKEKFLTAKDIAYVLDMSPDDVLSLARKGTLKGTKQGRFLMFRMSDVEAYKKKYLVKHPRSPLHGHRGRSLDVK